VKEKAREALNSQVLNRKLLYVGMDLLVEQLYQKGTKLKLLKGKQSKGRDEKVK